ncbi:UPF0686 protein C11orf1 homolog [Anguilla anguilla]|uniref:UPF0686 protein C11orf1 homolog n=1 Tax=Anguilla anguilla TaxID=7936 RepID=UPI0015B2B3CC|nr:UPF0686 protein C11orf1 homolog [Anguilla anguilla]
MLECDIWQPHPSACLNITSMEFPLEDRSPSFHYMVRASGQGEVWQGEDSKFDQYGWRCSTGEDSYSTGTLIGNWSEERFDIRHASQRRPLPSQFSHYFETTYSSSYKRDEKHSLHTTGFNKEAHAFPGHQPELDPPHIRCVPSSSYRVDFKDHMTSKGRKGPQAAPQTH